MGHGPTVLRVGHLTQDLAVDGISWQALGATYIALVAIILVRYLIIAGMFHYLLWMRPAEQVNARRLTRKEPTRKTILHEMTLSFWSAFIYAAPGAYLIELWKAGGTAIYSDINGFWGWVWLPASLLIYLFLHDTYFYWTHRWMHHPKLYPYVHRGHHKSSQPTPWASFSFDPWEAVISAWWLPAIALFIPIHVWVVMFLLIYMTFNAVANHAGWEIYPKSWLKGWFGELMITASHHNIHHTTYKDNYGLYFRFWDKLMKTDTQYSHDELTDTGVAVTSREVSAAQKQPV